ncbi:MULTISPECIES: hypothetical protein [Roseobacteraceae]|uniref:Uncharacterized protein n=1 Tax=Celeribacter baekdonensis B30 TaxID=1208323 RepID=K2K1H0_9RHOB|nr:MULTISPECIES: hypothetical protein [Roseobacteraceae]EKE71315.1 hypothetical protein B30_11140 [Celeribacter baekdonensis B30]KAB6716933.1 hypothetical protein C8029_05955 [Roseobacter sp. TSBP12]
MSRRILIHAGFHKTGATTLQDIFVSQRGHLAPHVEADLQDRVLLTPRWYAVLGLSGHRGNA